LTAQPSLMGVMLAMICMGFGMNAGNSMNPARDFGPRLFSWMAGYGWEVFRWISRVEKSRKCRKKNHCSFGNYWFWVPLLCPFVGSLLGSWTYQLVISAQITVKDEELQEELGSMKLATGSIKTDRRGDSTDSGLSTTYSSAKQQIRTFDRWFLYFNIFV
jgi:hypothetical protein